MSEITGLSWSHVDLPQGIVRLEPGETKNTEGRTVYLDDELRAAFERQWNKRKASGRLCSYEFPNAAGTGRIVDFRRQ